MNRTASKAVAILGKIPPDVRAALDVFDNESSPDPAFFHMQNCILQPHAAVHTHENRRDLITEVRHLLGA